MRLIQAGLLALFATISTANARAQTAQPTVRKIADIGSNWISGIIETRNGRFIVYAEGDSIRVRDRHTGATRSAYGRATDAVANSLGSSVSGDRIVFASLDDEGRGPFVWTLAIDTLNGQPVGPARRVGVVPATDPSMSPDGGRIAFAERDTSRGGIAGGAVRLLTIPSGGGEASLVVDVTGKGVIRVPRWSADGSSIYFQLYPPGPRLGHGPTLWRVSARGGRPDSLGPVNLFTDVSPDGRYLAMFPRGTNWQRTPRPLLSVTDPTGKTVTSFMLPHSTRPYSWSRTGAPRILAVQGYYPSTVRSLNLATGAESAVSDTNSQIRKGRYSPDGSRLVYQAVTNGMYQFFIRDTRGGRAQMLATSAEPGPQFQWSPDGRSIAFIAGSEGRWLHVVSVTGGGDRRLVNLDPNQNFRWRSDSRALHYVSPTPNAAGGPGEIREVTVDGRDSRVAATPAFITAGDWISLIDDTSFVARHAENGVRRLHLVSMTTGAQHVIFTGQVSRAPSPIVVSPDRKWIAFSIAAPNAGGEQVGIAALDGTSSRVVGPPMECGAGPAAWHPDGKHLLAWAYPSCASGGDDEYLYLLSLNGDAPKQLTKQSGGHGEWSYSLAPDGRTVLYETETAPGTRSLVEIDFTGTLGGRGAPPPRRTP